MEFPEISPKNREEKVERAILRNQWKRINPLSASTVPDPACLVKKLQLYDKLANG